MLWARMVAYVTGTVNQELLLRNEYLGAENRILRDQIKGRLLLSEGEKATLAEIAQRLGRKALEELAAVAKPDTLLAWYRKLIANKCDGSRFRQRVGRPRMDEEAEQLVVQMAKENPGWGYSVPTRTSMCARIKSFFHSLGESAGELGRNDALPGP
jgi:putative transposase